MVTPGRCAGGRPGGFCRRWSDPRGLWRALAPVAPQRSLCHAPSAPSAAPQCAHLRRGRAPRGRCRAAREAQRGAPRTGACCARAPPPDAAARVSSHRRHDSSPAPAHARRARSRGCAAQACRCALLRGVDGAATSRTRRPSMVRAPVDGARACACGPFLSVSCAGGRLGGCQRKRIRLCGMRCFSSRAVGAASAARRLRRQRPRLCGPGTSGCSRLLPAPLCAHLRGRRARRAMRGRVRARRPS
jgi:hypothetical protein